MKLGTRLAITTATVVATSIVASGAALVFVSDRMVRIGVDRDMIQRARTMINRPPGPPPERPRGDDPLDGTSQNGQPDESNPRSGDQRNSQTRGVSDAPPADEQGQNQPDGGPRQRFQSGPGEVTSANDDHLRPRVVHSGALGLARVQPAIDDSAIEAVKDVAPYFSTISLDGRTLKVLTLKRPDGLVVQTGYDLEGVDRIRTTQIGLLGILVPIAIAIGGLVGLGFARQAVKPVKGITDAASQLDEAALSTRLTITGDEEIAALARQFNLMLGRLEASFGQRQELVRKLEALLETQRAFVADASHELKTPLARLKLIASASLSQDSEPEDYKKALTQINQGTDQMSALVQQLLTLARYDSRASKPIPFGSEGCNVGDFVESALQLVEVVSGPPVEVQPVPAIRVSGRCDDLSRALANVIENAKRYAPGSSAIQVSFVQTESQIQIKVADQGEGISPEDLPRLTERFFRVDSARARPDGGTGLGLAITKAVLESNGGGLEIESQVGKGTTVSLICAKLGLNELK